MPAGPGNGCKPRAADDALWKTIFSPNEHKRHWWIARRVRFFLHKLSEAKRLRKKVNLISGIQQLRDPRPDHEAWEMSCVYSHFRPMFEKLLTQDQLGAVDQKFIRGYLDAEFNEKCKVQSPGLTAADFRFLSEFNVAAAILGPAVDEQKANEALQKAEVQKAVARLQKEEGKFQDFVEKLETFNKLGLGLRAELVEKQKENQRQTVAAHQESVYPVRDLSEVGHGTTFYEASFHRFLSEQESIRSDSGHQLKVYWLNSSTLGYDAVKNSVLAVKEYSGLMASKPKDSCLILACPTVGPFGNEYVEDEISAVHAKLLEVMRMPEHRLVVREVTVMFDFSSFPQQSSRPAVHKFYMAVSDLRDTDGEYVSVFAKSPVWKRQLIPAMKDVAVLMNPVKGFVDPRRDFSTAAGSFDLSRPSRRKQWLSGWSLASAWLQGLLVGMGFDKSTPCTVIDSFAYDHSMAEAIMRLSSNSKLPSFLYVGLVWAEANTREAGGADKRADALKVATWLSVAIKRRIQACATEGILVVPGWEPVSSWHETRVIPTLASTDFTCCFPSASNELPLRATFLKTMEEKLSIPEVQEEWQNVIKAHNAKFNKAGVPYSGEGSGPNAAATEGSEGNTGQKRKLDSVEEPPQGNKLLKLEHHGKGNAIFDVDGNVWFQAKDDADAALDHDGPPIALIYGNFKIQQAQSQLIRAYVMFLVTYSGSTGS